MLASKRVFLTLFWFLCVVALRSQCLVNPYIPFANPGEELNLLPDTASYYVEEELYNADTLTRKRIVMTYHNFGDERYAIYSEVNEHTYTDKIIHYQKLSGTFAVQTVTNFRKKNTTIDSTLIWWEKGLIHRATIIQNGNIRTNYLYEYVNGVLSKKTINPLGPDKKETWYYYNDKGLSMLKSQSQSLGLQEFKYQYSDSLTTESYTENTDSNVFRARSDFRIDKCGNKLSVRSYTQSPGMSDFTLYQSQDFIYYPDGGYQMTATQNTTDDTSIREFHPGYIAIERWTWPGSDQVWIKRYIRL